MAIEIVDLSIKNGDFHSYVNVYQRVFSIKSPLYPYDGWLYPQDHPLFGKSPRVSSGQPIEPARGQAAVGISAQCLLCSIEPWWNDGCSNWWVWWWHCQHQIGNVLNWGILASKLHHLSTGNHWVILGQNKSCSAWKTCWFKPTSNGFSRETCNFYTWEPSHCDITTDIYWHGIAVRLLE